MPWIFSMQVPVFGSISTLTENTKSGLAILKISKVGIGALLPMLLSSKPLSVRRLMTICEAMIVIIPFSMSKARMRLPAEMALTPWISALSARPFGSILNIPENTKRGRRIIRIWSVAHGARSLISTRLRISLAAFSMMTCAAIVPITLSSIWPD